ncbi:MAG: hypothetical protein C4547_11615 [Phycisphaerales bacterium]|nr:MAG: hypothetical protein C4547_11615 [Phycisphaerales bacterium]
MRHPVLRHRLAAICTVALSGGTLFLSLPSCETTLKTLNPCATVFEFCDANDIELIFADIPDYDLDPTCTIPFLTGCSSGNVIPQGNRNFDGP